MSSDSVFLIEVSLMLQLPTKAPFKFLREMPLKYLKVFHLLAIMSARNLKKHSLHIPRSVHVSQG